MESTAFTHNPARNIRNYKGLRIVTLWAGSLGLVQAIIWIALTITGILSYNCVISVSDHLSYGSLMQTIFLDLYFKGHCVPNSYQGYNSALLDTVTTVLNPRQILIWESVYLGVCVCWLLTSIFLLTYFKKDAATRVVRVCCFWVFFTFWICVMDFALGVIFGIDYGHFSNAAYNYNFSDLNAGDIDPNAAQLIAAMVAAVSMMILSFKGFVLWIINVALMIYLLLQTILISNDNGKLFRFRRTSDHILSTRPPINAYEIQTSQIKSNAFLNGAFVPDKHRDSTMELNEESIARAARMSTDVALQEHRFRNLDTFQQYPKKANNKDNSVIPENPSATSPPVVASFPAPDYTPPMTRANQNSNQKSQ